MRSSVVQISFLCCGLWLALTSGVVAADDAAALPFDDARKQDRTTWREMLAKGEYDALEKIGDDLRATNSKYRNGRERMMSFVGITEPDAGQEKEEVFQTSLKSLNRWLKAKPTSINVRLHLAVCWASYASFARGDLSAAETPEVQHKLFAERSAKAEKYLDEIDKLTDKVDNVYRRLRIGVAVGQSRKPDVELVYDGLKDDPLNMELIQGIAAYLLPRWFGEEGELEEFADEVVRRTKDKCGEMHYTTTAIAIKRALKTFALESHKFDWKRIRQGFRDFEKAFPTSKDHFDDEAQFAFLVGDLPAILDAMKNIGDQPREKKWSDIGIRFDEFRKRFEPDMMQGDQKRVLVGHIRPVLALDVPGDGKVVAGVNWDYVLMMFDIASGERRGSVYLRGIRPSSVRIHPKTGLLAAGNEDGPGVILFSLASGQSGSVAPSEAKVMTTAYSSKGDLLAIADEQGLVAVVDLKTGKAKHTFAAEEKREITGLAFSGKADQLAASCGSGELLLFNLKDDKLEATRKVSDHALRSLAWADPQLAVGNAQGEVIVLDGPAGDKVAEWKTEPLEVAALTFSPDGEKLAIGVRHPIGPRLDQNWDTPVAAPLWVWNYKQDKTPQSLSGHKLGVNCVRFTDKGKTLISGSHDWTIRVWDVP